MKIAWLFVWLTLALVMVIPVYPTAMVGLDAQDCHDDSEIVVKVPSITRDLVWLDASVSVD